MDSNGHLPWKEGTSYVDAIQDGGHALHAGPQRCGQPGLSRAVGRPDPADCEHVSRLASAEPDRQCDVFLRVRV